MQCIVENFLRCSVRCCVLLNYLLVSCCNVIFLFVCLISILIGSCDFVDADYYYFTKLSSL